MDYELYLLVLVLTGVGVGFTTGLLGIGGGFIMVPILYYLLINMGFDPTLAIRAAFGTSLAIIIPTALSSAIGHYRKQQVDLKATLYMGLSGFLGALLGGYIATHIPGDLSRILFSTLLLLVAFRMLLFKESLSYGDKLDNVLLFLVVGCFAGIMSGLFGVGGGIILIPAMVLFMGFNMREAGGTSSAIIILTSIGGILAYVLNGLQVTGLPSSSVGYVNLLQVLVIVLFSIPLAQIGTWASLKLPEKQLRYIVTVLMIYISLKMMGIFNWLGLPL
ncbi:MAG: sulfite exporter TauE/SafE family protein [Methanobacterium sp.]|nr:sulfite exporter TauE/SafE family protein [Methanobacterium sp.]